MKAFFALLLILHITTASFSQTISWDGGAGTHNWEDANNWSGNALPTIQKDVIIDNDSVSINSNVTIKSLTLKSTHQIENKQALFLQNGYSLSIFNSTAEGLYLDNDSRFWNAGNIIISNTITAMYLKTGSTFENMLNQGFIAISLSSLGINCYGTFQNRFNTDLEITDITTGILNNNQFSNRGNLSVFDADEAIINNDSFLNRGELTLIRTSGNGIQTAEYFKNFSNGNIDIDTCGIGVNAIDSFINEGTISITQAADYGLKDNFGVLNLTNSGTLDINNARLEGIKIDDHRGTFTNETNGLVHIIYCNYGMSTLSKIINNGSIEINWPVAYGISSSVDTLFNSGLIKIENSASLGLTLDGVLINNSNAKIEISNIPVKGLVAKENLINDGEIIIKNAGSGLIFSSDTLVNNGFISIKDIVLSGINHYGDLFVNNTLGEIGIDSTGEAGFHIEGKFKNNGSLNISNSDEEGLYSECYSDTLINNGLIEIHKFSSSGLRHDGMLLFNTSNGEIIISADGIYELGLYCNEKLINEGLIDINSPIDENTYPNAVFGDTLINEACGQLISDGPVTIYSFVHNKGIMSPANLLNGPGNTGSILNDGTFINTQFVQNFATFTTNNGNIIKPLIGTLSESIKEMNVAAVGGSPLHNIPLTWWADEAKTTAAGTYDNVEKTFTPNAAGVSADTLWVELDNGTCSIMASIPVNQEINCENLYTATFTGTVSSDWHTPENWDIGIVPEACTIVTIPAAQNCTITTGRKARAYRIEVETGSVFDAELGVVLDVNPEN